MTKRFTILAAAASLMLLCGAARAQQQGQDQNPPPAQDQGQQQTPDQSAPKAQGPIPAYHSPLAGAVDNEDEETTTEIKPDEHALTGAQPLGLGSANAHSYWQPHANLFVTADSNPGVATGGSSWGTWISFSGGVDVHKVSENNELEVSYLGGGMFSNTSEAGNGAVQSLEFLEKRTFHRWALTLIDGLAYLPESGAGFNGLGVPLPGGGGLGGGTLSPGQSLLVGRGQNLSNQFDAEADVFVTGRTSLTFVGGYSSLNYFDSDLLNYGSALARVGYNYLIDRKNTIGVDYEFGETNFSNFHQKLVDHEFQVAYGRRVTGRLAFQIAAGPEIATFTLPITPGSGVGSAGPTTSVYWSLNTNLQYQMRRNFFGLSYVHSVAGGSGVLAGAEEDLVSGSVTRQMTRQFSSGITGGYARDHGLAVLNPTPTGTQTFDYWYGGGNLTYPLGRTMAVTLSYQLQYQTSGTPFCVGGGACATDFWRNMISVGLDWRDRPRRF